MTVRGPFDKLRVPSSVEPSTPLRLDPERGRGVEGRNRPDAKRDGHAEPRESEAYLKQYVEIARSEPARQTELARAAAFDHIAAERSFAFGCTARLVAAAYRRLQ